MGPIPLVAFLLGAASAQTPAPAPFRPHYEIILEKGVDDPAVPKVMKLFKKLQLEYPGLITPETLKAVVFVSPSRELKNCFYCRDADNFGDNDCRPFPPRSVVLDQATLARFQTAYADFYGEGRAVEAVLFHELLHGWAFEHPDRHKDYLEKASDGRLTLFERDKNRLFRELWKMERKIMLARLAAEDQDHPEAERARARESLEKHERRLEDLRSRFHLKTKRFNRRHDIPRRDRYDVHAVESEQEWFAYGGEIALYAREPAELLTENELAWWKKLAEELRRPR